MGIIFVTDDGGDTIAVKRGVVPTPGPRRESRIAGMVSMTTAELERSAELNVRMWSEVRGKLDKQSRRMAKHFRDTLFDLNVELIRRYRDRITL